MKKGLIILSCLLTLSACGSTTNVVATSNVKLVSKLSDNCELLGIVTEDTYWGMTIASRTQDATNKALITAEKMGANVAHIINTAVDKDSAIVTVEAAKCP